MATPQERLADAISGERRDWHRVEVETDDLAAVLSTLRATAAQTPPPPRLTPAEVKALQHVAMADEMAPDDYAIERGPRSGHAFAVNGFSMAYDLTAGGDVDADSIDEADRIVAGADR